MKEQEGAIAGEKEARRDRGGRREGGRCRGRGTYTRVRARSLID